MMLIMRTIGYLAVALVLTADCTLNAQENPPAQPQLKGELIYLRDYGTDDIAYLVVPEQPPACGIVIVPDGYGLDVEIKKQADALSKKGYLVLVADLYNGAVTPNPQQADRMLADLMEKSVLASLKTSVNFFQTSPRFKVDKVAMVAVGGTAFQVAKFAMKKDSGLTAVVFLEPPALPTQELLDGVRCPAQFLTGPDCRIDSTARPALAQNKSASIEVRDVPASPNGRKGMGWKEWAAAEEFIRRGLTQEKKENILQKLFD